MNSNKNIVNIKQEIENIISKDDSENSEQNKTVTVTIHPLINSEEIKKPIIYSDSSINTDQMLIDKNESNNKPQEEPKLNELEQNQNEDNNSENIASTLHADASGDENDRASLDGFNMVR